MLKMFEGLNWKPAFKRAAIFSVIWLALVYVLSTAFPGSFGIRGENQITALAFNAVLFFFLYALLFAFFERRRSRRAAGKKAGKQGEKAEEPEQAGRLKGVHNPNTSSRKARRTKRRAKR